MFEADSRYFACPDLEYEDDAGHRIIYKARRFIAPIETSDPMLEVTVANGQRLDQISYSTLGKPTFYWKIGDANLDFSLQSLEIAGKRVRIPLKTKVKG